MIVKNTVMNNKIITSENFSFTRHPLPIFQQRQHLCYILVCRNCYTVGKNFFAVKYLPLARFTVNL